MLLVHLSMLSIAILYQQLHGTQDRFVTLPVLQRRHLQGLDRTFTTSHGIVINQEILTLPMQLRAQYKMILQLLKQMALM